MSENQRTEVGQRGSEREFAGVIGFRRCCSKRCDGLLPALESMGE